MDSPGRIRSGIAILALLAATFTAAPPADGVSQDWVDRVSQAVVAYGFLVSNYSAFSDFLSAHPETRMAQDMHALERGLDALQCDLTIRIGFAHRSTMLQIPTPGRWADRTAAASLESQSDWLAVLKVTRNNREAVLVILSSSSPERTTVFWLDSVFASTLVYDSFSKGKVAGDPSTLIGSLVAIGMDKQGNILLKERAEPGSRGEFAGELGRVFKVDVKNDRVTLVSNKSGVLPNP